MTRHDRRQPPWWSEGDSWPAAQAGEPTPPADRIQGRPGGAGWGQHGWGHGPPRSHGPGSSRRQWAPGMPRRFRRRLRLAALLLLVGFLGFGWLVGQTAGDQVDYGRPDQNDNRNPIGLVVVTGFVVVVGSIATGLAYRRISRPLGDLLGAAERVAEGDYEVAVRPDGPRELRALTATFNDMAARLATTDEQRRRFLADVTHELRTPLAILRSGIEAQIDGIHARDDAHLTSLLEETQRLGRLVEDLHTLALAEAGRIVLHPERIHPGALVEDAVASHRGLAENQGVTLEASVAADVPDLDLDPTRIRQVLDNLLSNAVRHTPAGRAVRVRVNREPNEPLVRLTVTDAGTGFPAGQFDHVFDRFARAADSGGSGLGLSIARDLVAAHGGTIRAWNEPAGGASVSLTLPVPSS
jgi:signal transduction histidine kinase